MFLWALGGGRSRSGQHRGGVPVHHRRDEECGGPEREVQRGSAIVGVRGGTVEGIQLAQQAPKGRGLHCFTSELNLRTFRDAMLTLQLNLSTFGTHPRVNLGHMGDKRELKLSGMGRSTLKLSGTRNECEPLPQAGHAGVHTGGRVRTVPPDTAGGAVARTPPSCSPCPAYTCRP
jgi:hypothetical protein